MRALVFAITLGACATAPMDAGYAELAGCWANRSAARVETMLWRAGASGLEGELSVSPADASAAQQHFTLTQETSGWRLCEGAQQCWQVAHENTGSLEGGRAFIDRFADRLRIGVVGADGVERKIFEGERKACPA